ncbi:MAG: biotin--[acetyl-CoA-carboxylase] ligase, partial [FCB group bacterium]|nr:biotin--[acetyl-CoA-carboxylase] ligase [FCB group bacterium]
IIKPKLKPEDAPGISLMTALALADSIGKFSLEEVKIKWPNDIVIDGKKVAGILTELSAEKNKVNFIIVGVGINVNQKKSDFPDEIKKTATSLRRINKRKSNRIELLKLFLVNFEKEYERYQRYRLMTSRKKIRQYSSLLGHHIMLTRGKTIVEGKAVDINEKGALIIEKDKKLIPLSSGEVSVVKENTIK